MPDVLCLYPGLPSFRQRQVAAHRALLDALGVRLILASDDADAGDPDCFAGVIELPPSHELRAGLAVLESELARRPIDGVLAQSESALCLGTLVARNRGARCLTPESTLLVTSKALCRERLAAAGVAQPRFARATSAADVRRFAADHGYPVVLKATASALARLVALVRAPDEVEPAVARLVAALPQSADVRRLVEFAGAAGLDLGYDARATFLVEAFAAGLPVESDGVVQGDRILGYGVTEQVLTAPPLFFIEGYLTPADLPGSDLEAIERASDAALRALGVRDTGFSVEMRWQGGVATILEVNGRLGWDEGFGDLFAAITGAQPVLQALQVALGMPVQFERRSGVRSAVAYSACYEDRVVARAPDEAAIAAAVREHGLVAAGACVRAGDRMHAPPHPDVAPHLGWALAHDPRSSRAAYERARRALLDLRFELAPIEPHKRKASLQQG